MKISEKQRKAAAIYWGKLLLEGGVTREYVTTFECNLESLLENTDIEIDSLSLGLDTLKIPAVDAGIDEQLFPNPTLSMTFDEEDNLIVNGKKIKADAILKADELNKLTAGFIGELCWQFFLPKDKRKTAQALLVSDDQLQISGIVTELNQKYGLDIKRKKISDTEKYAVLLDEEMIGVITGLKKNLEEEKEHPKEVKPKTEERKHKENPVINGFRVKESSGLLVSKLEPSSEDDDRYQAYQWYVQGRAQARRLLFYSRLAKLWGSPFNLFALIPIVSFLTSYLYWIYLNQKMHQESPKISDVITWFLVSCIPFVNLAPNYLFCEMIRNLFQMKINKLLNEYYDTSDSTLTKDKLDVIDHIQNIYIKNIGVFNKDLAPQNDKVVLRRLTEEQFTAYSHRSQHPNKPRAAETPEVKSKKLIEKVPRSRFTGTYYHVYMDQEQNNRFENRFQRLQLKKGKNNPTLFNVPTTINPQSKSDSVKIINQVMDMYKKAGSPSPQR